MFNFDLDLLKILYLDMDLTTRELEPIVNRSYQLILYHIKKHKLSKPFPHRRKKYQQEAWLKHNYIDKNRKVMDIAQECGVQSRIIRKWLRKYELPLREIKC